MSAQTLPSSSKLGSNAWNHIYDVFLSFRGEDTRKSFTDHLYTALLLAGIITFREDDVLHRGENVSTELLKAISESRIYIVIFSKGYASSRWCLDELVEILYCVKTRGHTLLSIFYHVNPSDVRKQTGIFAEAFARHEQQFQMDMERVQRWRTALTEASNFPGYDLARVANGHESTFIKNFVEIVLYKVKPARLDVSMHKIREDSRVEEIKTLLNLGTSDVRIVRIYGMDGIGKTTLAKAVCNQISHVFEGSSFLLNIKEISEEPDGLVHLQEQLLSDILTMKNLKIDNVDRGINLIKEKLRHKKVLVVLDDVSHLTQLLALAGNSKWFGVGSRVIAMTRDEHLLTQLRVDAKYRVEELTHLYSLQLFSRDAFNIPHPIEDYHELSIGAILAEAANRSGWDFSSVANGYESHFTTVQTLPSFSKPCSNHWDHDVFLSFGGEHLRKTFIDHLKSSLVLAGIRTFLGSDTRGRGENISARLLKAIRGSRISVVVFSEEYAYSRWCLDELAEILHCAKTNDHCFLPIFHNVKPTDV